MAAVGVGEPVTRAIVLPLALGALLLIAGCSESAPPPAIAAAKPSATASAPAIRVSGSTAPTRAVTIGPFSMQIPDAWQTRKGLPNPSGNWTLAWLGPEPPASECESSGGGGVCHPWPVSTSVPGGILVAVRQNGLPGSVPPSGGAAVTVAGLDARRFSGPADDACTAIGGSRLTRVVIPVVPGAQGWFALDACLGPGIPAATKAAFDAMTSSVSLAGELPAPSG